MIVEKRRLKLTRILITEKVVNWLSLNTFRIFFGTVPTFGFRILVVENVGSQNFSEN